MGAEGGAKPADATWKSTRHPPAPNLNHGKRAMPHAERTVRQRTSCAANGAQLGRLALESLATGVFVSLVLALAVFIVSFEAHAAGDAATRARARCCCATRTGAKVGGAAARPPTCTWT